jgi:ceruloplasmin
MDITDETKSWYFDENINRCGEGCRAMWETDNEAFEESNVMWHINGRTFGNLPELEVCEGTTVVFYFMSLQAGLHTPCVYGQTMTFRNHR